MTQDHLSREQLEQYRDRVLPASVLPAADAHLGQCMECRETLAALTPAGSAVALLSEIATARSEHLTYEQMDAWVEEEMDQTERELVMAHLGICDSCAHQLRAYEAAAPAMSVPVPKVRAAKPVEAHPAQAVSSTQGFGDKFRAFFQSPQLVLMLAAGIALVIGAPYLALRTLPGGGRNASINDTKAKGAQLDTSELDALPQALALSAREVLDAEQPVTPDALVDVPPSVGFAQMYPVTEVVESARPTLSWDTSDPPPYTVELRNAAGATIFRSPNIVSAAVVVPMELERGAVYTWELKFANGTAEEASFVVMDEGDLDLWRSVRAQYPNSHLMLGLMAQNFGLLSIAQTELEQLVAANPNSEQATKLLDNVIALRE